MPLCFMHNKGESVSKRLQFNEYILKKTWEGSKTIILPWCMEKLRQSFRFSLISNPAALGSLYHQWKNWHFFHCIISVPK